MRSTTCLEWILRSAALMLCFAMVLVASPPETKAQTADQALGRGAGFDDTQLKRLVGHTVEIRLRGGRRIRARLVMIWPRHLGLLRADGKTLTARRASILRIRRMQRSEIPRTVHGRKTVPASGFARVGMVMTLASLALEFLVAIPAFIVASVQPCDDFLCIHPGGMVGMGVTILAVPAGLVGIPMWVAAAVHGQVRTGSPEERKRKRALYKRWGIGLTLGGLGLAAVGGVVLGASPPYLYGAFIGGVSAAAFGTFVTLFIGLPMWVEAIRSPISPSTVIPTAGVGSLDSSPALALDPVHERWLISQQRLHRHPATMLSYGWTY